MTAPRWEDEEEEEQRQPQNGAGPMEPVCSMKLRMNIGHPKNADVYNPVAATSALLISRVSLSSITFDSVLIEGPLQECYHGTSLPTGPRNHLRDQRKQPHSSSQPQGSISVR